MNTHPYLRAYMAGTFVPSLALLVTLTVISLTRLVWPGHLPLERVIIFPMAVVPNAFGLWNMLYLKAHTRMNHPIGLHGAVLPLLMAPIGALVATHLNVLQFGSHGLVWFQACAIPYALVVPGFLFAMAAYYLVWKYIVGSLNRVLDIA